MRFPERLNVVPLTALKSLSRPAFRASMPASFAPHPGADAVQVAPPAASMALHGDRQGVEQFAVTAGATLHAQLVSLAGEVGDQLEADASHAPAMLGG